MKFLLLSLVPLLIPMFSFANQESCIIAKDMFEGLKLSYDKTPITKTVKALQENIQDCGQTTQKLLGVDDSFLNSMAKESRKRDFLRTRDKMAMAAQFGGVERYEEKFTEYSKEFGYTEFQKELSDRKQQAAAATAMESKACTSVDLTKDLPPIRNQDSIGWCYAFTAADLASFKLKKTISAADIALGTQDNWSDAIKRSVFNKSAADFEGGLERRALKEAQKNGFCLESEISSEDNINGDYVGSLRSIDRMGRKQVSNNDNACSELYVSTQQLFPAASLSDLRNVIQLGSEQGFINNLRNKSCKKRINADFEVTGFYNRDFNDPLKRKQLANAIDEQLSNKNFVAVGIDSEMLYDHDAPPTTGGNHSVGIAGRRFNKQTGQCEYMIRNSWGRGCGGYDTFYECKDGKLWISKLDLMGRLDGVTYVK